MTCGRKEKQEYKIGENLSLEKKKDREETRKKKKLARVERQQSRQA